MRPLELTRSGIIGTIVVFIVAAVCIRLGMWQLDRREQRSARNAVIAERLDAAPTTLERVPSDTSGLTYRRAVVEGLLDGDRSIVVAGRSYRGSPGAHVFTPVRTGDGAILANRGWLPAPDAATVDPAAVRVEGNARLEGVLMPFPDIETEAPGSDGFEQTWFRLDGRRIRSQYPYPVAELYLQVTEPNGETGGEAGTAGAARETGVSATDPIPVGVPALDSGPHLSYAVQWFGFATVFILGWAALLLSRGRGGVRPAPAEGRPPG